MTDLCHGAKVVPNGEKYKNRFDMKRGAKQDAAAEFQALLLSLIQRLQKEKRRDPLGSQRFGTPARARTGGLGLRRLALYPTELQTHIVKL